MRSRAGPEVILSQARVVYAGAPYASTLFEMPSDAGALVLMRVFVPTGDRDKVRSALQIDVTPRENDFASVSFNYAVFVEGDEAFWVPGGVRLFGPEGTRSFQVFRESEAYLVHDGEVPWADLDRPLEPGVELRLSFAVGIQHDGSRQPRLDHPVPARRRGLGRGRARRRAGQHRGRRSPGRSTPTRGPTVRPSRYDQARARELRAGSATCSRATATPARSTIGAATTSRLSSRICRSAAGCGGRWPGRCSA